MALAVTEAELQLLLLKYPFTSIYGFRLHAIAEGQCTIEVPFQTAFERPGGLVSGPVFMAAADVATWLALMTRLGAADHSVTVEMKTNFLNPARQEDFRCTAKILKLGRRLAYGVAECIAANGTLLTHHTLTYYRPDSEEPSAAGRPGGTLRRTRRRL
jgi:uncharacterized protein (TIGR00369 family)